MKWEPFALMILLIALGAWLVAAPALQHDLRPGAKVSKFDVAGVKGHIEVVPADRGRPDETIRLLIRGSPEPVSLTRDEFTRLFGPSAADRIDTTAGNIVFRALNITSYAGIAWVMLGFAGQIAFVGRMFIQWMVSEKQRASVIPPIFWWLSLTGGILLFTYFVWRQDIVGVLGQSSGIVIYARNLRLISKTRRRDARKAMAAALAMQADDPDRAAHSKPAAQTASG